jgi:hypothetical protein
MLKRGCEVTGVLRPFRSDLDLGMLFCWSHRSTLQEPYFECSDDVDVSYCGASNICPTVGCCGD